jgi:hypothetical protein
MNLASLKKMLRYLFKNMPPLPGKTIHKKVMEVIPGKIPSLGHIRLNITKCSPQD